jgi:single-stranded DNA-binding protein
MIYAHISGNITADAILKNSGSGDFVTFTIANNTRSKTADGTTIEKTVYVRCISNRPEMAQMFYKGRHVAASGTLTAKVWEGNAELNLRVEHIQVCGPAKRPQLETAAPLPPANDMAPIAEPTPEPLETVTDLPF